MKRPLPPQKMQSRQPSQDDCGRLKKLFDENKNEEFVKAARALLVKFPKNGIIWKNLGTVLQRAGRLEEALDAKSKSVEYLPQNAEITGDLGNTLLRLGKLSEAVEAYIRALKINSHHVGIHSNLGLTLSSLGRFTEATEHYRCALALDPHCVRAYTAYTNLFFTLVHNPDVSSTEVFQEAIRFGEFAMQGQGLQPLIHSHENRDPNKKLHVAMVSGDFFNHAVSFFIEPLLTCLDKNQFELVAYYNNTINDSSTQRLKSHFAGWRDVAALTDVQLVQQMANDGIDIAIDLSGHTDKNRLLAFAYKPAPIQISWIGYPGTTGLKAMDYYLVDSDWCPPGLLDDYFVEKLVQLPSAATFAAPANSPPVVDAPALKNGYITFGSFNRTSKLTQETLDLWCKVLNEIPTSKMIVGNVSDEPLQRRLEKDFLRRGVAIDRLTFYAKKTIPDYLALHGEVDFILDTFPYAGGTTTGFALWMGVPVLSYVWNTLPGRAGFGWASSVGLTDKFAAHTPEQFIEMAKSWSENVEELQALRHQLRDRMKNGSKLKPENVTAGLEKGLRMMWERFCAGKPVESFVVPTEGESL